MSRDGLPIAKQTIIYAAEVANASVVVAPPVTGVYTELPRYLYETWGSTLGSEERIAVVSDSPKKHASWLASALNLDDAHAVVGSTVGVSTPFEDVTSDDTRVKYLDADMLIREAMVDPLLRSYSVVVVYDVHLRRMWTDILVGVLKKILKVRPSLHIVLHCSTDDMVKRLQAFLKPVLTVSKDQHQPERLDQPETPLPVIMCEPSALDYPVDVVYTTEPVADYVEEVVSTVTRLIADPGKVVRHTIIVIVATKHDSSRAMKLLSSNPADFSVAEYANQQESVQTNQDNVLTSGSSKPHVIVTWGTAENDVTLIARAKPRFVIDCGFSGLSWYSVSQRASATFVYPISKAQAEMRRKMASRAGTAGLCLRLYTEQAAFDVLTDGCVSELVGGDLCEPLLRIMVLGVGNVARSFPYLTAPSSESVAAALTTLTWLGAVDRDAKLTKLGEQMAQLPLSSLALARAICVAAEERAGCVEEMLSIAAMVAAGGLSSVVVKSADAREHNRKFYAVEGDYMTLLNIYSAYTGRQAGMSTKKWAWSHGVHGDALQRAHNIRFQLAAYLRRIGLRIGLSGGPETITERILYTIGSSFFLQAAKRSASEPTMFELVVGYNSGLMVKADMNSVYADESVKAEVSPWVVYERLVQGADGTVYMSGVSSVERSWLEESGYYKTVR